MPEVLNPTQLEAVHHTRGPCLVIAGAGSGKTRVIAHKIARLLHQGVEPDRLAAITFTNKAAREMRQRVSAIVGNQAAKPVAISTFHALGVRILRESGEALGLKPRFSIMDSDDALAVIRDASGTSDAAVAKRMQWTISAWKNAGLNAEQAQAVATSDDERVAARVMQRYSERLVAYQSVDFDDLIALPLTLLGRQGDARTVWRQRFDHVLVDEMQDTNTVQYALLKHLVDHPDDRLRGRFTAVGDDDQSIYGWRGATLDNLKNLRDDWPTLKVVALEQNYRSTGAILRAANHVIAPNPKLFVKTLWSEHGEGDPVRVQEAENDEHEAERAVHWIQQRLSVGSSEGKALRHADFAVLYRANFQSRAFEQKLRAAQIPYKVSGGQSFFERTEIRDLCAWMRLIFNSDDDPAFLRAVTTPKRGIGHQTLATLGEFASKQKTSLFEALFSPSLAAVLPKRSLEALHGFGREINDLEWQSRKALGREAAQAFLMAWLQAIGYEQHLHDHEDQDTLANARWSNVLDFVGWMAQRCGRGNDHDEADGGVDGAAATRSVMDVAQTLSIMASLAERGDDSDAVTLSTLHAAKGLEWPHVMLAGVNDGSLPFFTEANPLTPERVQEERRLMYVGITRARQTLTVSSVKRRKRGREIVVAKPSRFIAEMKLSDPVATKVDAKTRLAALRKQLAAGLDAQTETQSPASEP
jgi:ATP-dependent DNA helicase Rep